jgi:hypothetical protein
VVLAASVPFVLPAPAPVAAAGRSAPLAADEGYDLARTLMTGDRSERKGAARELIRSEDLSMVPPLVDALFYTPSHARGDVLKVLRKLTGEDPGRGYYDWVELVGRRRDLEPKEGYLEWKVGLLAKIDPEYRKIFYPGAPARIRLEEIVFGGVQLDGIPALVDPPRVAADEADALSDGEEVFGVGFGGEHHAFPLRYLSWHEMANDVVGGQAFVLSF